MSELWNICVPHEGPQAARRNSTLLFRAESRYLRQDTLFIPTFQLSQFPILPTIANILFPGLPKGPNYLTAKLDKLEIIEPGARLAMQSPPEDDREATILVTLPTAFMGGELTVSDGGGRREVYPYMSRSDAIHWAAFTHGCNYEVGTVEEGYRVMISYGVHIEGYGPRPSGEVELEGEDVGAKRAVKKQNYLPLVTPAPDTRNLVMDILRAHRGRKVGFYLRGDLTADPTQVTAKSLVPFVSTGYASKSTSSDLSTSQLKGGDAILHWILESLGVNPQFCWVVDDHVWPFNLTVSIRNEESPRGCPPYRTNPSMAMPCPGVNMTHFYQSQPPALQDIFPFGTQGLPMYNGYHQHPPAAFVLNAGPHFRNYAAQPVAPLEPKEKAIERRLRESGGKSTLQANIKILNAPVSTMESPSPLPFSGLSLSDSRIFTPSGCSFEDVYGDKSEGIPLLSPTKVGVVRICIDGKEEYLPVNCLMVLQL